MKTINWRNFFWVGKKDEKTAKYLLLEVVATGYVAMRSHDNSEALSSKQRNIFLVLTGW